MMDSRNYEKLQRKLVVLGSSPPEEASVQVVTPLVSLFEFYSQLWDTAHRDRAKAVAGLAVAGFSVWHAGAVWYAHTLAPFTAKAANEPSLTP